MCIRDSGDTVRRYIRLTELVPELLDMVDRGEIKFNPAVELSYLAKEEQKDFLSAMDFAQAAPSLSQAQRIKKLAQEGECTLDAMCEIMNEIKKGDVYKRQRLDKRLRGRLSGAEQSMPMWSWFFL